MLDLRLLLPFFLTLFEVVDADAFPKIFLAQIAGILVGYQLLSTQELFHSITLDLNYGVLFTLVRLKQGSVNHSAHQIRPRPS